MGRRGWQILVALAAVVVAGAPACSGAHDTVEVGQPLEMPAVYASRNGTLHLRVTAVEAPSTISHRSYQDMRVYRTQVVDGAGTFTPGTTSAYVAPEWHVMPGDHLVIDYVNDLTDQQFTPIGEKRARPFPQPINLHTHGLTVRPNGNGDNVLLSIPQGRSNRFVIDIPKDQHAGLYWYHPHIHGLSDDQVYEGLAGHIVVGRADGNYRELDGLTTRPMMIRYNVASPGKHGELIDASPVNTKGTALEPRGAMVYTVNGLVSPTIPLAPADPAAALEAESQVWVFTNITGSASYILSLDEVGAADALNPRAVGRPLDLVVVSIDGTSMPAPKVISGDAAKRGYLLGQGGRVALLVHGASDPTKVVRLLQVENRSGTGEASASDWTNRKLIGGYRDYNGTVLAVGTGKPSAGAPHVDTPTRLTPNLPTTDHALASEPVATHRTLIFNDVSPPSDKAPNEFPIDFGLFPDVPIAQPRVGTVEEWTILNYSPLHHPFHVHTQYNQVMSIEAPVNPDYRDGPGQLPSLQYVTDLNQPQPADYLQDLVNLPPALVGTDGMPELGPDGVPVAPGKIVLRVKIDSYLGTYVEHCHRLPHEDRGMMSMVRSIPNQPVVATTRSAADGATVDVVRGSDGRVAASIVPFPGSTDPLVAAVGDFDGDTVPDVSVASAAATPAVVKTYSGASGYRDVIATAQPFGDAATVGSLALGDMNGDSHDELIAGQGAGGSRVVVVDSVTGNRLSDFDASDRGVVGGINVATGILELGGRVSLITGAGPGGPPKVDVYNFDLFGDANGNMPDLGATGALKPLRVAEVLAGQPTDTGGVAVATGYPFAQNGGFASVVATPLAGPVVARTYTLGSHDNMHTISASGVFLAEDYEPGTPRALSDGPALDLRADAALGDGGRAALVSTPNGADLVIAPTAGGAIRRWTVGADGAFAPAAPMAATGATVAAM